MGEINKIEKLPQEVIDQIAAGEVVERPASVVKELLDNAIDSGATKIHIKIEKGGKKLIDVSDNGGGMTRDQLISAFEAHTTSKLRSLSDLDKIDTMGFRGEALSSILSVSDVVASSKRSGSELGTRIVFKGIVPDEITDHAMENGTTISINKLFNNIPARLKYLRTDETEYRYIFQTLIPFFIYYNEIHFIFTKDGKDLYNLPRIDSNEFGVSETRIKNVMNSDFVNDLIPVYFDGNGLRIDGFIAHPQHHQKRPSTSLIFLNERPISDPGLRRSVYEGFGSFIPRGEKVPFIININIPPDLVDINVHPRKEEVRFLNPYRVYSAVEQAVSGALRKDLSQVASISNVDDKGDIAFKRLREDTPSRFDRSNDNEYQYKYDSRSKPSVSQSLQFSGDMLNDQDRNVGDEIHYTKDDVISVHQIFNKYLIIEFPKKIWFIDQHAAAERITFEKLNQNLKNKEPDIQNLMLPETIKLNESQNSFYEENLDFFKDIGFDLKITKRSMEISSVPVQIGNSDLKSIFDEIDQLEIDQDSIVSDLTKIKNDIVATISCHNSIRSSQKLDQKEILSIYEQLIECKNPYSCPHGRPIVWELDIDKIDTNFDRTY